MPLQWNGDGNLAFPQSVIYHYICPCKQPLAGAFVSFGYISSYILYFNANVLLSYTQNEARQNEVWRWSF